MIYSGLSRAKFFKLPNLNRNIKTIDIKSKIPNAENFTYEEFISSNKAKELNIDNIPSKKYWKNIELLAQNILQPVRKKFGPIRITSGFRSLKLNTAIGGSKTSNHLYGNAADIEIINKNISQFLILEYIHKHLKYSELIYEYPPNGWIHVAYHENIQTKEIKLKDKKHNYKIVSLDYIKKLYGG